MLRILGHGALVVVLTAVSQLGGIAWLLALTARRRVLAFALAYGALWAGAMAAAPLAGRVALPCWGEGPLRVQSWGYCLLNRTYVVPELRAVLEEAAVAVEAAYPGRATLVLDGGFPFLDGFPLLPHLSHGDGRRVDLALQYERPGVTRSPVGYLAFEAGPSGCPARAWDLRWDLPWLQPWWRDVALAPGPTALLVRELAGDARVGRMFLEPHLVARLGVAHPKVRFQGCRAARHDDHLHVELAGGG